MKKLDFGMAVGLITCTIAVVIIIVSVLTGTKFLEKGGLLGLYVVLVCINIYNVKRIVYNLKFNKKAKMIQHIIFFIVATIALMKTSNCIIFQICAIVVVTYTIIYVENFEEMVKKYERFFAKHNNK